MKNRMLILALVLWASIAQAVPNAKDVTQAMNARDYQRAEQMLDEVIVDQAKRGKDSARAHYMMAQVKSRLGNHQAALAEFNKAQTIDPDLKFTTRAMFDKLVAYENQQLLLAQTPKAQQSQAPTPIRTLPAQPMPQPEQSNAGSVLLWVLLVAFLISGIVGVLYYLRTKQEARTVLEQKKSLLKQQQSELNDLLKTLADLDLQMRTHKEASNPTMLSYRQILREHRTNATRLLTAVANSGTPVASSAIKDIQQWCSSMSRTLEGPIPNRPEPDQFPRTGAVPKPISPKSTVRREGVPTSAPSSNRHVPHMTRIPRPAPTPTPVQTPVHTRDTFIIHEQAPSNDLANAVILSSVLDSQQHEREREARREEREERDSWRETPVRSEPEPERYSTPEPDFDPGTTSSNDTWSESPSESPTPSPSSSDDF